MRRIRSIDILLKAAEEELEKIRQLYGDSAVSRKPSDSLLVAIKTFCEHLRSALDYVAHDIQHRCCPGTKPKAHVYFPITETPSKFSAAVEKWCPGLKSTCPQVWNHLESVQPYKGKENEWLETFRRLSNDVKHSDLVAHEYRDEPVREGVADGLGPVVFRVSAEEQEKPYDSWVEFILRDSGKNSLLFLMGCKTDIGLLIDELL
jgi:hypothetical protein